MHIKTFRGFAREHQDFRTVRPNHAFRAQRGSVNDAWMEHATALSQERELSTFSTKEENTEPQKERTTHHYGKLGNR
ncbi:hypothetical protein ILYODFUR_011568 [Ilyodon furcidens]|uniref:Uncharacterized protein n=1 Tax=Ilyodon furcidens TaxID=33524 RepID=A0ABV0SWH4_9TELE